MNVLLNPSVIGGIGLVGALSAWHIVTKKAYDKVIKTQYRIMLVQQIKL